MKKIKLGGNNSLYTIVDDDVFDTVKKHGWCVDRDREHRPSGVVATIRYKRTSLHRMITNCPKGKIVDHINGDPLDNRLSNLRICEQRQNCYNRRRSNKNKTSIYKGVYWYSNRNKWCVNIGLHGNTIYCGLYKDEKDAAHIYDQYAIHLFGDYAATNFAYLE